MDLLPSKIIENCYSIEQLDSMNKHALEVGERRDAIHDWEGPNFGKLLAIRHAIDPVKNYDLVEKFLAGIPKELSECLIIGWFLRLQSFVPYEIHNDYGYLEFKEDEEPFYVFIVPFETVDSKTIAFNQASRLLHFIDYKNTVDPLPENQQLSEEEYNKYFSHCWPQERPYISIDSIFDWKAGSLYAFDVQRWHASNNYLLNGVTEKNAIIMTTKIKKQHRKKFIRR